MGSFAIGKDLSQKNITK